MLYERILTYMNQVSATIRTQPPDDFRPLLWSLKWEDIDIVEDKEDIIINTINEGSLDQWRWLLRTYGAETVRRVLGRRLATELHPESRNLAKIMFSIPHFRHARTGAH